MSLLKSVPQIAADIEMKKYIFIVILKTCKSGTFENKNYQNH